MTTIRSPENPVANREKRLRSAQPIRTAAGSTKASTNTTDDNGTFLRTPTGIGARVKRPGFPESYARKLIEQTGTKLLVPQPEKK